MTGVLLGRRRARRRSSLPFVDPAAGGFALGGGEPWKTSGARTAVYDQLMTTRQTYYRIDVNWEVAETSRGQTLNWGPYDAVIGELTARGLKPFIVLHTVPGWANANAGLYVPPTATYRPDLIAHTKAAVKHFRPMGVLDYEIGNEINLGHEGWSGTSGGYYTTDWLIPAATGVQQAEAEVGQVRLHFGSLAPDSWGGYNPNTFLQEAYAAGAKPYFDHMNYHPYIDTGAHVPTTSPNMTSVITAMRNTMLANSDGSKTMWGTEMGCPTSGNFSATETYQRDLVDSATTQWLSFGFTGPLLWYTGIDKSNYGASTDREDYFGVLRANGSQKPAFARLL